MVSSLLYKFLLVCAACFCLGMGAVKADTFTMQPAAAASGATDDHGCEGEGCCGAGTILVDGRCSTDFQRVMDSCDQGVELENFKCGTHEHGCDK